MTKFSITRREFAAGGLTFTVASFLPAGSRPAFAAAEDDRIVASAKPLGAADLRGMIWSNYYVPMQPAMEEFKKLTGIGVGSIQDISIFDAPQRAMAEALSRSPQFDFFHIDFEHDPVARLGRAARAARRIHEEGRISRSTRSATTRAS